MDMAEEIRRRGNRANALIKELEARLADTKDTLAAFGTRPLSYYALAWRAARLDATMAELELLDDLTRKAKP